MKHNNQKKGLPPIRKDLSKYVNDVAQNLCKGTSIDPDDIAQDVFLDLYKKNMVCGDGSLQTPINKDNGKQESIKYPKGYLNSVVKNTFIRVQRKEKKRTKEIELLVDEFDQEDFSFFEKESRKARDKLLERTKSSIENLPEESKTIIYDKFIEGKPYKEISKKMGIKINNLKNRVFNIKKRLRYKITQDDNQL